MYACVNFDTINLSQSLSDMSDHDSEVFSCGDEDSDTYSHSVESHHFGSPTRSSDLANSPGSSLNSSQEAQYRQVESNESMNSTAYSLVSSAEMWESDDSLSFKLQPGDSDRSESCGIDDCYDSSDPDDEILADVPSGLCESHFQLLCEGSDVTLIEGMILIFQYALK